MKNNILIIAILLLISNFFYDYSKQEIKVMEREKIVKFIKSEIINNFDSNNFEISSLEIEKTFPLNKIIFSMDILNKENNKIVEADIQFKLILNESNKIEVLHEKVIIDTTQSEQALLVRKNFKPDEDYIGIETENKDPNKTELFYLLSTLDNKINVLNTNDDFVLISIGFDYKGDLSINYYESKLQILAYIMFLLTLGFLIILIGIELFKFRNKVFE